MNFVSLRNYYRYNEEGMEVYIDEAVNIGYRRTMRTLPLGIAGTLFAMFVFFGSQVSMHSGLVPYVFNLAVYLSVLWAVLGIMDWKRVTFSQKRKHIHSLLSLIISLLIGWIGYRILPATNGMERTSIVVWLFVLMVFTSFANYATPRIMYAWCLGLSVFLLAIFIEDGTYGILWIVPVYSAMMSFIVYGNYNIYNDFIRQHVYKARASLEYERQLDYQWTHDLSTGLFNRYYLDMALEEVKGKKSGILVLIEILNNADLIMLLGLEKRNEFIRKVIGTAENFRNRIDAKVGSNTYAILTTETDIDPVEFLEGVQKRIEEIDYFGFNIDLRFNIGARIFSEEDSNEKLFDQAYVALYSNRELTDRMWHIYDASVENTILNRLRLAMDIDEGILQDQFLMYYQPQVDAVKEKILSFEALIRWQHPSRGFIPSDSFIPLAEETGKIVELGYWIIDRTCRDAKGWQEPWDLSVNVAVRQLEEADFAERVNEIFEKHDFPWERMTFEITESSFVGDSTRVIKTLDDLSRRGGKISLDDFGTGYSSMSYLAKLPLNELKIDRYFIWHMDNDKNVAIVEICIDIAKRMGLSIVAEGIESYEHAAKLCNLGCDKLQGYYYSKPVGISDIGDLPYR